jgi:hypothetical protein
MTLARRTIMTKSNGFQKVMAARVCLAILIFVVGLSTGCGGGGSSPVVPDQFEYRLQAYDGPKGGTSVDKIDVEQGKSTWIWVQLQFRTILYGEPGPWGPVTSEEIMDVTIKGSPSGDNPVDLGGLPAQCRLKAGAEQQLSFWPPLGGHGGATVVVLSVPARKGAWLGLTVTVIPPSGGNPPPPTCRELHPTPIVDTNGNTWDCDGGVWKIVIPAQTCRDLHPCAEYDAEGNLWDCLNGQWVIVDPVDPPTNELYAHGDFGDSWEFHNGGVISILQANACYLEWFIDYSRIMSNLVTFESADVPEWVWNPQSSEIVTIIWAQPDDPDLEDAGNQLVIPGDWEMIYRTLLPSSTCKGTLRMIHRDGFTISDKGEFILTGKDGKAIKTKPHPNYRGIAIVI